MKAFLQEYGLMIVSIIVAFMFFSLVRFLVGNDDQGIIFVFRNHQLYTEWQEELGSGVVGTVGSPLDAINGVQNTSYKSNSPYFKVSDSFSTDFDTFKISDYLTLDADGSIILDADTIKNNPDYYNIMHINGYDAIVDRFTDNGNIWPYHSDGTKVADANDVEIVITTYEPQIEYLIDSGVNKRIFVTEQVDAVDKYGNRIWNVDAKEFVKVDRLKYEETHWHRHKDGLCDPSTCTYKDIEDFEINMRAPCKIKVLYRYQDNALKCEYTKVFKNEVIDAYTGLIIDGKLEP